MPETFKIEIFLPGTFLDPLRIELNKINVGVIGNYDNCFSITAVAGFWRPSAGAEPYQGEIGQLSSGTEVKVEVNCPRELVGQAIEAIRAIHPYDEPLINIIPLFNDFFEQSAER